MTAPHFLTFDIEHWYESWRQRGLPWDAGLPDRDSPLVLKLLDLLEKHSQKATFFFTGDFARDFPGIARACVERGHEVGSHSMRHTLLTNFATREAFREDLFRSLESIEQACGVRPAGFRAPKWTIFPDNARMILDSLAEAGLLYDSSFFPGHFPGIESPCALKTGYGNIFEIPATAWNIPGRAIPVGGAWFRVLPLFAARAMFRQHEKKGLPAMFYAHPYDLDPLAHCPSGTPFRLRCIRKLGVAGAWKKLERLLGEYRFTSIREWLEKNGQELPEANIPAPGL